MTKILLQIFLAASKSERIMKIDNIWQRYELKISLFFFDSQCIILHNTIDGEFIVALN